jgi:predicted dehydrogenase
MLKKFTVLIVGAGRIGAFFDRPKTKEILTHAHAFSKHRGFKLVGFVDQDQRQAQKAALVWGGRAYDNIDEAFKKNKIDVVVNATPDSEHFKTLNKIINQPIKLIFTEKPLTATPKEAKKIIALAKQKKVAIAVNYNRSFTPDFIKLQQAIKRGTYGEYLTGTGYYGKGFLHNGSHLINLLLLLVGDIQTIRPVHRQYDYFKTDPSLSGVLYFNSRKPFFIQSVDSRFYTIFEIDLVFSRARIRIVDSGFVIERYQVKKDRRYAGYQKLELAKKNQTKLSRSLYYAADNLYNYLQGQAELGCSLNDGYKTMQAIFNALKK